MSRTPRTEQHWPDETREELLARIEREHGPEVAAVVARDLDAEHPYKQPVPRKVGKKDKPYPGIGQRPARMSREEVRERIKAADERRRARNAGRRGFQPERPAFVGRAEAEEDRMSEHRSPAETPGTSPSSDGMARTCPHGCRRPLTEHGVGVGPGSCPWDPREVADLAGRYEETAMDYEREMDW